MYQVAIQHAVDSVLAAVRGKSGSAATTSAFTVRTPFGLSSDRTEGILGWLAYKEQSGTSRRGAVNSQGSGEGLGLQASVCEGGRGKSFLSSEKASAQETTLWIEDQTDRMQVVLTRRRFEPKAAGGAVMAVCYQDYAPSKINGDNSRGCEDRRKRKKRGRPWEDLEDSVKTQRGDWDVALSNASLFQTRGGAFDKDVMGYGDRGGADVATFGLVRVRGLVCRLSGCIQLCC